MKAVPRSLLILANVGLAALAVVTATILLVGWPRPLVDFVSAMFRPTVDWFLLEPRTYLALAVIHGLQLAFPADPRQPLLGPGTLQDLLYFLVNTTIVVTLLANYLALLDRAFSSGMSFLLFDTAARWPFALQVVASFLLGDLLGWLHHVVRHKVALLWRFHALHHSQREMNLFTDARNHVVDILAAQTIVALPFFVMGAHLKGRIGEVAFVALLLTWYPRFYHANIRGTFGWLRYVLVTPQSHRIHHSLRPEHRDKNFGVVLSIWDRAFGTHFDGDEYPETGVADPDFPLPEARSPGAALIGYVRQFCYPLRRRP